MFALNHEEITGIGSWYTFIETPCMTPTLFYFTANVIAALSGSAYLWSVWCLRGCSGREPITLEHWVSVKFKLPQFTFPRH